MKSFTSSYISVPYSSPRILLVDDNSLGLTARKSVLEELGYAIVTAAGAHEALEHLSGARFDLIVTDYKMPRMDGLELIRKIRAEQIDAPIILLSGFADTLGLNESNTGADLVIQKSANEIPHLVRAVQRLIRRKAQKKPPVSHAPLSRAQKKA